MAAYEPEGYGQKPPPRPPHTHTSWTQWAWSQGHSLAPSSFVPTFHTRSQAVMSQGVRMSFHPGRNHLEKRTPQGDADSFSQKRDISLPKYVKEKRTGYVTSWPMFMALGRSVLPAHSSGPLLHTPSCMDLAIQSQRFWSSFQGCLWLFSPLIVFCSSRKAGRYPHSSLSAWNPGPEFHKLGDFYSFLRVTEAEKSKIRFSVVPSKRAPSLSWGCHL